MSIDIEQSILQAGLVPSKFVTTPRWIGSIIFRVGDVRANMLKVGYDPQPDNDHHGEVWGTFPRATQRALSRACTWFVEIEGVSPIID
ncbi:MAG: hypothetical protein ABL888_02960 [Pirellulaceae bacterium]